MRNTEPRWEPGNYEKNVGAADLELTAGDLDRISEILPDGGFRLVASAHDLTSSHGLGRVRPDP